MSREPIACCLLSIVYFSHTASILIQDSFAPRSAFALAPRKQVNRMLAPGWHADLFLHGDVPKESRRRPKDAPATYRYKVAINSL